MDALIILGDGAMHQRREPQDRRVSDAKNADIHEELVTNCYLSHLELAADTPMPYGGTLTMTRPLDSTGIRMQKTSGVGAQSIWYGQCSGSLRFNVPYLLV